MVTKMNEPTSTTVIEQQPQQPQGAIASPTTIMITLHPQTNENDVSETIESLSPSHCAGDDTESIKNSQKLVKKSLKLDLSHSNNNNNDNNNSSVESPTDDKEDLSFKSPTSPKSPRNGKIKMLLLASNSTSTQKCAYLFCNPLAK
jgi:hypothetical protein